jgi:hypothetical protein
MGVEILFEKEDRAFYNYKKERKMIKVTIALPLAELRDIAKGGVMSEISWSHPDAVEGLNRMFSVKKNERIVAIFVSKSGIRARFESLHVV